MITTIVQVSISVQCLFYNDRGKSSNDCILFPKQTKRRSQSLVLSSVCGVPFCRHKVSSVAEEKTLCCLKQSIQQVAQLPSPPLFSSSEWITALSPALVHFFQTLTCGKFDQWKSIQGRLRYSIQTTIDDFVDTKSRNNSPFLLLFFFFFSFLFDRSIEEKKSKQFYSCLDWSLGNASKYRPGDCAPGVWRTWWPPWWLCPRRVTDLVTVLFWASQERRVKQKVRW